MLGEAHWRDAVNTHRQNGDQYVNDRYPICKKRPAKQHQKQHVIIIIFLGGD